MRYKCKEDPTGIILVTLTKRAVAVMAVRWEGVGHLCATGSCCWLSFPMGQWEVFVFWGEYLKGVPFLFIRQGDGNLMFGMSEVRWLYQTLF